MDNRTNRTTANTLIELTANKQEHSSSQKLVDDQLDQLGQQKVHAHALDTRSVETRPTRPTRPGQLDQQDQPYKLRTTTKILRQQPRDKK